jgi:putative membrane protein
MKSKIILSLLITAMSATSTLAFADDIAPSQITAPASTAQAQQHDGEIIALLMALNNKEINAAKLASKKATLFIVKRYAHLLNHEHAKNLKETLKLSKKIAVNPVETEAVITLKTQGTHELATLFSLSKHDFNKAYINTMIKDHTNALQLIDETIAIDVNNSELRKSLIATREHINQHLKKAKEIQAKIDVNANLS